MRTVAISLHPQEHQQLQLLQTPLFHILRTQLDTVATELREAETPQQEGRAAVGRIGVRRSTLAECLQNRETVAQVADLYGSPQRMGGSLRAVAAAQATAELAVMAAMAAQSSRV